MKSIYTPKSLFHIASKSIILYSWKWCILCSRECMSICGFRWTGYTNLVLIVLGSIYVIATSEIAITSQRFIHPWMNFILGRSFSGVRKWFSGVPGRCFYNLLFYSELSKIILSWENYLSRIILSRENYLIFPLLVSFKKCVRKTSSLKKVDG